jgi:hypothetical protein
MATNALRTYTVRSGTGATVTTGVALTAATAKSVVVVMGSAADTLALIKAKVTFSRDVSSGGYVLGIGFVRRVR